MARGNAPFVALLVCACMQCGICVLNTIKSYQISRFKIDRVMAFINSIILLVPVIIYTMMLISYDDGPTLTPLVIEWSVSVPLLLVNAGKLLNYGIQQYAIACELSVAMTLTGYASASAKADTTVFALFGVSGVFYASLLAYMFVKYRQRAHLRHQETNFPSHITHNNLIVFRTLFGITATTWNGYPITYILWKTGTIGIEDTIIVFVCLDFVTKGLCVLIMLAYTLVLHHQNGYLTTAFKKVLKIHPLLPPPDRDSIVPVVLV